MCASSSSSGCLVRFSNCSGEKLFLSMSAIFSRGRNFLSIVSTKSIIACRLGSSEVRSIPLRPLTDCLFRTAIMNRFLSVSRTALIIS